MTIQPELPECASKPDEPTTAAARNRMNERVTIDGIDFWVGQKWRERDKRFNRVVEVIGWKPALGLICIKYVRKTWARANRFNGTGYVRA